MQAKHWAIMAACLSSIASMGLAMHDWSEARTPQFVFGVLGVMASHMGAMYMQRPNEEKLSDRYIRLMSPDPTREGFRRAGKTDR